MLAQEIEYGSLRIMQVINLLLLVTILAHALLALVGRDLLTLALPAVGHKVLSSITDFDPRRDRSPQRSMCSIFWNGMRGYSRLSAGSACSGVATLTWAFNSLEALKKGTSLAGT